MKIFLSWSGARSRAAAQAFYDWIPDVLQSVVPWISTEDIYAGAGWNQEIRTALNESNFGLIFVTRDNLSNPWLLFEAGALAKHVESSHVVPVIVDEELTTAMLTGPLGQFQAIEAQREKIKRLVRDINFANEASKLPGNRLDRCFDANWQRLATALESLPPAEGQKPVLSVEDSIAQILSILRGSNTPNMLHRKSETKASRRLRLMMAQHSLTDATKSKLLELLDTMQPNESFISFDIDGRYTAKISANGDLQIHDTEDIMF